MRKQFRAAWEFVKKTYYGVEALGIDLFSKEQHSFIDPRSIPLLNLYTVVGMSISIVFAFFEWLGGSVIFSISDMIFFVLIGSTFLFTRKGWFTFSKLYFLLIVCIDAYYFILVGNYTGNIHFFFFLIAVAPFFLFTTKQSWALFLSVMMVCLFFLMGTLGNGFNPLPEYLRNPVPEFYGFLMPLVSFFGIFIIVFRFLKINETTKEKLEYERIKNEVEVASQVQQKLIPPREVRLENASVWSVYQPAQTCGGDWWYYFVAGQKVYLAIADATGHGIPSALITAAVKGCFSAVEERLKKSTHLEPLNLFQILSIANHAVFETAKGEMMMTMLLCSIDLNSGELEYVNAGHCPFWIRTASENKMNRIRSKGFCLGDQSELPPVDIFKMKLQKNDRLFLISDGLADLYEGTQSLQQVLESNMNLGALVN